jgi:hypothetical protein
VLVKAGKAEETVDVELNAYHEQFEVDFTQIKSLKKDMKKYLVLLKGSQKLILQRSPLVFLS